MVCTSLSVRGQYALDSLDLGEDVTSWFDNQIGLELTPLVLGTYKKIYVSRNTHPFYNDRFAIKGALRFRDQTFYGVDMMYHTHEDYLVIVHPTMRELQSQPICLEKASIDWFEIEGSYFRNYFNQDERNGFYEILVENDELSFVSKRVKTKEANTSTMTVEFSIHDRYYLFFEGGTFEVKRKGNFIKVFPQYKKEIKTYVQINRLVVKTKNEADMVELATYCGQLISKK